MGIIIDFKTRAILNPPGEEEEAPISAKQARAKRQAEASLYGDLVTEALCELTEMSYDIPNSVLLVPGGGSVCLVALNQIGTDEQIIRALNQALDKMKAAQMLGSDTGDFDE